LTRTAREGLARREERRSGEIWLQDTPPAGEMRWLHFSDPLETLAATTLDDVPRLLERCEAATDAGLWAAGFLSYEAAPAFDSAMEVNRPGSLPLAWFSIYTAPTNRDRLGPEFDFPPGRSGATDGEQWLPTVDAEEYEAAVAAILQRIGAGDTYQVNLTLRLRADLHGDPRAHFADLHRAQDGRYGAWIDLGGHVIASASPELFFRLDDDRLMARPMKGTVARGRHSAEDAERGAWLAGSRKNRAENLMIVDMIRNDLGRVARAGSVRVASLFDLERYPSVFQLTSTVEARTDASARDILAALFPCASITGAPKIRTMELIRELESTPRGIYTGSIGYLAPGRRAQFNVAIRSIHFDLDRKIAEYGTGGGIVWDSSAAEETREWRTKARILAPPPAPFRLLETLRWDPEGGWTLLERHLDRLERSADYFRFRCERDAITARLDELAAMLGPAAQRVRLRLDASGAIELDAVPLNDCGAFDLRATGGGESGPPLRLAVALHPVDSDDRFLFHKTTRRGVYDEARAAWPYHDDVLLWNERGEPTESTIANLVVRIDGRRLTPSLDSGLLAGTLRAELLERGDIEQRRLSFADLQRAEAIELINSVRGTMRADLDLSTLPGRV
jgi:para-aminobenzoate synthetase/4-amino-4-deoxychorismate lyase